MNITPETIKELRITLELSQLRFAQLVGVTEDAVANWENRRSFPSPLAQANLRTIYKNAQRNFKKDTL